MKAGLRLLGVLIVAAFAAAHAETIKLSAADNAPVTAIQAQSGASTLRLRGSALRALGLRQIAAEASLGADHAPAASVRFSAPFGALGSITQADLPAIQLALAFGETTLKPVLRGTLALDGALVKTQWRDAAGALWLYGDYAHAQALLDTTPQRFELRYSELRIGPALVNATQQPTMAGLSIGYVNVVMPIVYAQARGLAAPTACDVSNLSSPTNLADVELTLLSQFDQQRCNNCDGPAALNNGQLIVAPSAQLKNSGAAVVPWYEKFSANSPPYNNDQHPYLVWNMYRQDTDGVLRQIGQSGVKHAFFTVNLDCDCPAGNLLGAGCFDTYSGPTNDTPGDDVCTNEFCYQGPRTELIPSKGLFGRCGSIFDPNCDGSQSDITPYGPYEHRLLLAENELSSPQASGVRWFGDGWYIVRDEGNWLNNVASRELFPSWNGSVWSFPSDVAQQQGSILHRWNLLTPAGARSRLSTIETPQGRIVLDVRATQVSANLWRYQNTLFNYDFAVASLVGTGANIAVTDNRGLNSVTFQAQAPISASAVRMVDADLLPSNDWTGASVPAGVRFQAPGANSQNWGTLYSYIYESAQPPGEILVNFSGSDGLAFSGTAMGPSVDRLFSDGLQ